MITACGFTGCQLQAVVVSHTVMPCDGRVSVEPVCGSHLRDIIGGPVGDTLVMTPLVMAASRELVSS